MMFPRLSTLLALATLTATPAFADTLSVQIPAPPATGLPKHMGAATSPAQGDLAWDAASLLRNGKPWLPVMGEFHFSRYPNAEWRDELLKMKAGGITMISTYVFWIHHEEERGKFTWDGDKNLRQFIETCQDVGLPVIVRIGPWCHGEVRNGGFPDWVQALPRTRTNDPQYLAAVKPYYDQIGQQLKGLYWKDSGPIVGIQFENEFKGPAAHLVTLKQMGRDAGMDVPIYTRTAWDNATNFPTFGEMLPLWGGYAEGFWDRTLDTMPGNYWQTFQFAVDRAPNNAMGDPTALAAATQRGDVLAYPYLTCELGGGMMSSYHRRIDIAPMDVYAVALAKIGSGSNMPGYYMYHGGTNPEGKLSTLMESQSPPQNMWNDMPVKNYDFGAILGACGEVRESYHLTRMLHLFLNDWGDQLARMPATIAGTAKNKSDAATVRWSVRSDGKPGGAGYLFVNNYQRALSMPFKDDTQFVLHVAGSPDVIIPESGPFQLPGNTSFIWPFNMDLNGAKLLAATAQPICHIDDRGKETYFFTRTRGVEPVFAFEKGVTLDNSTLGLGRTLPDGHLRVTAATLPGTNLSGFIVTTAAGKKIQIMVLDDKSTGVWKGKLAGQDRVIFDTVSSNFMFDNKSLHMSMLNSPGPDGQMFDFLIMPPLDSFTLNPPPAKPLPPGTPGAVEYLLPDLKPFTATATPLKPAGTLRTIPKGSQGVAAEPADADFDNAATWRIKLPVELKGSGRKVLLRLHYTGDVARIYLGDKLILDDFYHGQPLDLALWRYGNDIFDQDLTIKILPLQKNAPIYFAKWPAFDGPSVAKIDSVELLEQREVALTVK